jgi:hypothetical protein
MEVLMAVIILIALCLVGGFLGVDSRPRDIERPTRWWPAARRS